MIASGVHLSKRCFQSVMLLVIIISVSGCLVGRAGQPTMTLITTPIFAGTDAPTSIATTALNQTQTKTAVSRIPTSTARGPTQTPLPTFPFLPLNVSPQSWVFYDSYETPGLAEGSIYVVEIAPNGDVWTGTDGAVSRFDGSKWITYPIIDELPVRVQAIAVTSNNVVWVSSYMDTEEASKSLFRFDGQTWVKEHNNVHVTAIEVDRDGVLWFAMSPIEWLPDSPSGVWNYDGNSWISYIQSDGLISDTVNDLAYDTEGTLWVATDKGISAFDGKKWENYPMGFFGSRCIALGPQCSITHIEVASDGSIWSVARHTALYRYKDSVWILHENHTLFQDWYPISGLCASTDGNIWIVKSGKPQLSYFDGEDWVLPNWQDQYPFVYDIQCASDGAIWIGGHTSIFKYLPPK